MASPHKRRGKKLYGSYGKTAVEVIEEAPKVAPIKVKPVVTPKPKKKKSFFNKE